ncbi:hypothetical protein PTKIN_Ptkin09bG0010100 [Pterospermum kingtungense]
MSSTVPQMSSGSKADEKKRKRMLSNRESARRSRMKKQKLLEDLVREVASLQVEIKRKTDNYEVLMQNTAVLESENNLLETQKIRLAQYLRKLEQWQMNLMLQPGSFSGENVGIKEPHVGSWQCHGSTQPAIMASSGMFNY